MAPCIFISSVSIFLFFLAHLVKHHLNRFCICTFIIGCNVVTIPQKNKRLLKSHIIYVVNLLRIINQGCQCDHKLSTFTARHIEPWWAQSNKNNIRFLSVCFSGVSLENCPEQINSFDGVSDISQHRSIAVQLNGQLVLRTVMA